VTSRAPDNQDEERGGGAISANCFRCFGKKQLFSVICSRRKKRCDLRRNTKRQTISKQTIFQKRRRAAILLKRDDPFYGGGLRKDTLKARVPNKLTKCRQSENLLRLSGNTGVINQTTNHNIMSTWLQLGSQQNIIRETKRRRL